MKDWLLGEKLESGRLGKILLGVIQSGEDEAPSDTG